MCVVFQNTKNLKNFFGHLIRPLAQQGPPATAGIAKGGFYASDFDDKKIILIKNNLIHLLKKFRNQDKVER